MKIRFKLLCAFMFVVISNIYSQQDAQYTQYIYNAVAINPGYAGTRGVLSVIGLHRSQWVGVDGAPRTQTLSVHSPIGLRKVALGGNVIQDEIGPVSETYLNADFAYTLQTSETGNLSLGLKAGARIFNVDFNKLTRANINDPAFTNIDSQVSPTFGLGAYYYDDRFYLGLSAPNILETDHLEAEDIDDIPTSSSVARERINFYISSGYTFDLTHNIKFKPAGLVKLVSGAPLQVDVSANFLFNEKFTLGAAYRWSAAVSAIAGFQISDSTFIGLAYDRETTELAELNDGSFEILLRFELFRKFDKLYTPRFF